jgi:hypothetical protein
MKSQNVYLKRKSYNILQICPLPSLSLHKKFFNHALRIMNRKVSFIIYRSYERQTIVLDWYNHISPNFRECDTHWSFPVLPLELPVRPSPGPLFRRSSPGPAAVFWSIPDPVPGCGQAGPILLIWSSSLLTLGVVRLTILQCSKQTKLIEFFSPVTRVVDPDSSNLDPDPAFQVIQIRIWIWGFGDQHKIFLSFLLKISMDQLFSVFVRHFCPAGSRSHWIRIHNTASAYVLLRGDSCCKWFPIIPQTVSRFISNSKTIS